MAPGDGDTRTCPECRDLLVFNSRYPVLSVTLALHRNPGDDGMRYQRAWVCRNMRCDYRELLGEADD
jgi:hypothetical protein